MCIIVYKPYNKKLPSKEVLLECFISNPDGAGFMYRINNNALIRIKKGYMNFPDLWNELEEINLKNEIVVHFRIGTAGLNNKANCHPYPVSSDIKDLTKLHIVTTKAVAHNGILWEYDITQSIFNDTQLFIMEILSSDFFQEHRFAPIFDTLIKNYTNGSRFIFFRQNETAEMWGNGWIKVNDIYFSNSTYKEKVTVYKKWDKERGYHYYDYSSNTYSANKIKIDGDLETEADEIEKEKQELLFLQHTEEKECPLCASGAEYEDDDLWYCAYCGCTFDSNNEIYSYPADYEDDNAF